MQYMFTENLPGDQPPLDRVRHSSSDWVADLAWQSLESGSASCNMHWHVPRVMLFAMKGHCLIADPSSQAHADASTTGDPQVLNAGCACIVQTEAGQRRLVWQLGPKQANVLGAALAQHLHA